jgi:hypothetical protein
MLQAQNIMCIQVKMLTMPELPQYRAHIQKVMMIMLI